MDGLGRQPFTLSIISLFVTPSTLHPRYLQHAGSTPLSEVNRYYYEGHLNSEKATCIPLLRGSLAQHHDNLSPRSTPTLYPAA